MGWLKYIFSVVFFASCYPVVAQVVVVSTDTSQKNTPPIRIKKPKPFIKEWTGGIRINTDGWTLLGEYGKYLPNTGRRADDYFDTRIYTVEFSEKKHPREIKRRSDNRVAQEGNERKFIYGKANYFYSLKLGYGKRNQIAGKAEKGDVSIDWVYSGGVTVGLLKPYYVNAFVLDNGVFIPRDIKYSQETDQSFMNADAIISRSSYFTGIGETQIVPGLHVRGAIHFDFAKRKTSVLAIESGFTAEYYIKPLQIMATEKAYPYAATIFIAAQFGKRIRGK